MTSFQKIGELLGDVPISTSLGRQSRTCEQHGLFESEGLQINVGKNAGYQRWSGCPECVRRGEEDARQAELRKEARREAEKLKELLGYTAIPERFVGRTLDNYQATTPEQARALKVCRYYAQTFSDSMLPRGMGIIMSGKPGTGKSHLATAILQALLPGHVGVYTTFMGMMNMIRSTYDAGSQITERKVLEKLSKVSLLVIDEIGVQRGTEDEHLQLFGIIDARYSAKLPTIILTNQDRDGLAKFVGDRLYDRLMETSRWIDFSWDSYRTKVDA